MYRSYADSRDVKQAAKDAGVTTAIARKYIEEGNDKYPAIADRVDVLDKRTIAQFETELLESRKNTMNVVHSMSKKLAESLESAELVLSSSRLYDEDGMERLAPNGKPIIPIDAATAQSVLKAARDIMDLLGTISGGHPEKSTQPANGTVNVGVVINPETARHEANKVMKRVISNPMSRDAFEIEGEFTEVIVNEASKRVVNANEAE